MASPSPVRVIKFWTEYKQRAGSLVAEDWVEYCAVGMAQKSTNRKAISELNKVMPEAAADNIAARMALDRWQAIEPAYNAWKSGQEAPVNGTPLAAWPGVTPEQAEVLRMSGLKSIEELADATEAVMNGVQLPNMRNLRDMAKLFLASSDRTKVASDLAAKEEQIQSLKEEQEELRRIILEMQAEREDKPRRGRPPKVATEEEATA